MSEPRVAAGWSEHRFLSFDKTAIFYRRLETAQKNRAVLLILHGMGEHGGRYRSVAEHLAPQGVVCYIPDLRGFGYSGGKRGCVRRFTDYFRDIGVVRDLALRSGAGVPFFILGHSFGGLIAASWIAASPEPLCRGMILSSPNFGISIPVPAWRRCLALWVSRVVPDYTQGNRVDLMKLTHDLSVIRDRSQDPAIHNQISAGLYRELLQQLSRVKEIASKIRCSSLILQAGDDRVVSRSQTVRFYEYLDAQDKELEIYENLYHELLNEVERPAIFVRISAWIEKRLDPLQF